MEKRYQVFVSSTYADLQKERKHVIQALMEMDCIPAGMELFPAADEEQWEFIKKVIDDCDYYLLIIGGRYGSTTTEGISYTEKEYDYALEKGIKVVALIHDKPDEIPLGKSDINPELRIRLMTFRDKVKSNRLVKFWNKAEELPGIVALSLSKTIKSFPAIGWVRANMVANEKLLSELNELRKENDLLKERIKDIDQKPQKKIEGLAGLEETFTIHGKFKGSNLRLYSWESSPTWKEIFFLISPYLLKVPNDEHVKNILKNGLFEKEGKEGYVQTISDQEFKTITVQLKALGLINTTYSETTQGGRDLFWTLTSQGERLMMQLRTVSSKQ